VSPQRSASQAEQALDGLKQRFPSLLGEQRTDIQRADLGEKGTYYRVRIGPMTRRADAVRLCERLKAAGGSCFVTR